MGRKAGTTVVSKEFATKHARCPGPTEWPSSTPTRKIIEGELAAACKTVSDGLECLPSYGMGRRDTSPAGKELLELHAALEKFLGKD